MAEELVTSRDLTAVAAPVLERVQPEKSFARQWLGGIHPVYLVGLALLVVVPWLTAEVFPFGVSLATSILVLSIFTMSLDLLLGYAGLPSFGHAAFLGLGAYATAILSVRLGVSNLGLSLLVAIGLTSLGSVILGLLALRTSGVYFLMLTLAFAQMLSAVAEKWGPVTGGTNGLPGVRSPELLGAGLTVGRGIPYYFLTLAIAAACFFVLFRLIQSPFGRTLIGIHQNEARMRAIGYNTRLYKLGAFWVAGVFAGIAGVLYAYFNQFISPADVGFAVSGTAVVMVLLGGQATLVGPVLGTAAFVIIFVRGGIVGIWARRRGAA
jgi:branched-chain amino acid transport system permease protein